MANVGRPPKKGFWKIGPKPEVGLDMTRIPKELMQKAYEAQYKQQIKDNGKAN